MPREHQSSRLESVLSGGENALAETGTAYNELAAEVEALREEIKDNRRDLASLEDELERQKTERARAEGVVAYVETQLATLRTAVPAQLPVDPASTNDGVDGRARTVKLPDPPIFDGSEKDSISFDDWYLQMQNKMLINESMMATDVLKKGYVQNRTSGNAFAQLKSRLRPDATRPFATANEMFEVLTAAFDNPNRVANSRAEYRALQQGEREFSSFWAEFQRYSQDLDHSEATLIDDLLEKIHHSIARQLATGDDDFTDLNALAKRCQLSGY